LPCARENRGGASARSCSADRCASWLWLRSGPLAAPRGAELLGTSRKPVNRIGPQSHRGPWGRKSLAFGVCSLCPPSLSVVNFMEGFA
jgi:hypothetical protein